MQTINELKQQIEQRVQIDRVVGADVKLKRAGANLLGLCPFHDEKSPSFTVSIAKGIFKCFGCGASGDMIEFVMRHHKLKFVEALTHIAALENMKVEFSTDGGRQQAGAPPKRIDTKFVDKDVLAKTLDLYERNPFFQFLARLVGAERAAEACLQFYVGTARGAGTIFWQVDQFMRIRTAQKIHYGPDGHRIKAQFPIRLFKTEHKYEACLFGEHQLLAMTPDTMVCVVESEKTAVICSIWLPVLNGRRVIWIASSGSNGMTEEKMWVLRGLEVCLVTDFNYIARATWGLLPMRKRLVDGKTKIVEDGDEDTSFVSIAAKLQKIGCRVSFYDPYPGERSSGDIADKLVEMPPPVELAMPDLSGLGLPELPFC